MFGSPENRAIAREIARLKGLNPPAPVLSFGLSFEEQTTLYGREYTARGEDSTAQVYSILTRARKSITIAHHGLESEFFEDQLFQRFLQGKLKAGVRSEIVFTKPKAASFAEANEMVAKENPELLQLKHSFPDNLRLFWVSGNLNYQFVVVDTEHLIFTEPVYTPEKIEKKRQKRNMARGIDRLRHFWDNLSMNEYEKNPLTEYSTIPYTISQFNDHKAARMLIGHFEVAKNKAQEII